MTILLIAGHGRQRDGSFDPGAVGYLAGEHRYMVDTLFPAMKKYLPKGADVVFYSEKKVSNHGNLTQLVKKYNASTVVEFHYDAHTLGSSARNGHVIVHSNKTPNKLDLAIRDAIKNMVGVRYSHKGQSGISGRGNLYNVNDANRNGIDYRLIELGFGTNKTDSNILVGSVDEYAKRLVEAITGASVGGSSGTKPVTPSKPKPPTSKPKNPVLRQGDRGVSVQKAQTALVSKGYSVGKSGTDSIFGKDTDAAVRAIQKDGKIKVDGIIGKDTWKLLNGSFSKPKPTTPKPSGTIKVGDRVVLSKNAKKFSTGETIISSAKGKTYTVKQVKSDRVLLDEITSWVFVKDVGGNATSTPSPSKPKTLKVGSKVKIKSSAKNYSRTTTSIPASRKNKTYTVEQVSKNDVLIKELYSWVKKTDLI